MGMIVIIVFILLILWMTAIVQHSKETPHKPIDTTWYDRVREDEGLYE